MGLLNNFKLTRIFQGKFSTLITMVVILLISCNRGTEQYSIIKINGVDNVGNYSKSFYLLQNLSDSINPAGLIASKGDLIVCDNYLFVYTDTSKKDILIRYDDSLLYINNKISSVDIPGNDNMIPWFRDLKKTDISELQFISFESKIQENYFPFLAELAEIRPDIGLYYSGDFADLAPLLKMFKPRYIVGATLIQNDYDQLSGLNTLELLTVILEDSILNDPLPPLPALKQLFLEGIEDAAVITNDFLKNNPQIEKVILNQSGSFDFTMLNALTNLKELVIFNAYEVYNLNLIESHKKLEFLSITGDDLVYDPVLIKVPSLRWMNFSSNVTQEQFNSFVTSHPDLEVIGLLSNDIIRNLNALKELKKLAGLTVTDTVTDISTIKVLRNLKYLSLPAAYLDKSSTRDELQKSLPGTLITANEGFCLGSGWLLLLIPLVFVIRLLAGGKKHSLKRGINL